MSIARRNGELIVRYATVYPFRLPETSMVCVYCCEGYSDPAQFRKHNVDEHLTFNVEMAFAHIQDGGVKADCTDLRCRLCDLHLENLSDTAKHLSEIHNKQINHDYDLGIQPFKLESANKFSCAICSEKFTALRTLSRHTLSHFANYTCEACGKSYTTYSSLQYHVRNSHESDARICRKCKARFTTLADWKEHCKVSKQCGQHLCNVCGERFSAWHLKQNHMEAVHGKPKRTYPCLECNEVFEKRDACRIHFRIAHTSDHVACTCCGRKFDTETNLKRHMPMHTGEKFLIPCNLCSKSFETKRLLRVHMWEHDASKKKNNTVHNKN